NAYSGSILAHIIFVEPTFVISMVSPSILIAPKNRLQPVLPLIVLSEVVTLKNGFLSKVSTFNTLVTIQEPFSRLRGALVFSITSNNVYFNEDASAGAFLSSETSTFIL